MDGRKVISVKDLSFFAGLAGIKAKNAPKSYFDDIEVSSIKSYEKGKRNELIPFFTNHEYVQSRTVLDDGFFGIGNPYPGQDRFLAKCEEKISNEKKNPEFNNIGFHWQTLDGNGFRSYCGEAKGPGFVIAQSFSDSKKLMWSVHNVYGNWQLEYKIRGNAKKFGVILQELESSLSKSKVFTFEYDSASRKLKEHLNLEILGNSKWKQAGWNKVSVEKTGKSLSFSLNGIKIGEYNDIPEDLLLRPAIFYSKGTLFIDNIFIRKKPDIFYHFEYNQPFYLALSDWVVPYDKKEHWGGYHSYFILSRKDGKAVSMFSKRSWRGDVMFSTMLNPGLKEKPYMKKFSISFENPRNLMDHVKVTITPEKINLSVDGKLQISKKLEFNSFNSKLMGSFPELDILRKKGFIYVYLSDKKGAQRLVLKEPCKFPATTPFKIKVSGFPRIAVHSISIWGKELK